MRGCERNFIASVAHLPEVVALRVEGLDNISFARMIAPDKFIIGLVKHHNGFYNEITPDIVNDGRRIIRHGADMVATSNVSEWMSRGHSITVHRLFGPFRLMLDLDGKGISKLSDSGSLKSWKGKILSREAEAGNIVFATTFEEKGFCLVEQLKASFPNGKVNLEGGIQTAAEVQRGFELGADYVTIGKAINDPPTIIKHLMER